MTDELGSASHNADDASARDAADIAPSQPDRGARTDKTRKILDDADRRDDEASARDAVSEERAEAADREAFLDSGAIYPGHKERRAAAIDRAHAKGDREASADDRVQLTEDDESIGGGEEPA